jgi:hypothetical protein
VNKIKVKALRPPTPLQHRKTIQPPIRRAVKTLHTQTLQCISQKIVCIMKTKYNTDCIVGTAQSEGSNERMNGKRRKLAAAQ